MRINCKDHKIYGSSVYFAPKTLKDLDGLRVDRPTFSSLFNDSLMIGILFNCGVWICNYSQRVVDLAHLVAAKWPGVAAAGSGDPLEDFCQTNPADEECKVYEA